MINRFNIRARLMTSGAIGAVAMMAFAGAASAQTTPAQTDPDATQVDEIVVTGIRASIANSIAAKARNTSIVEVISAEDIGKLPDVSIAESLGRLPGLSTQRLDGRSQQLSIRGLGPDFTTALLNGREQVTTGDNRGVEFDQYPSELLSGVTVYKTPDAALIGQGLAGTVDMQSIRPLSYGHRTIAVNARYELNDIGALNSGTTDHGNRYSISYIDQFLDGTLGVAIGYAHMESPYQSERFNSWGYANLDATTLVEGGIKPYVMSSELKRDGYMGTLEWRPNDRFSSTIDAFYSKFENSQILRGIEFPLQWGGSAGDCTVNVQSAICRPGPALRPGYTVQDGLVTAGTYDNVKGVVRNDFNGRNSEITSIGWNTKFQATDDWGFALDLNYSKVDRTDQILESYSGTGRNIAGQLDSLGFTLDGDGVTHLTSNINYADPNLIRLTSPQGWGGDIIPGGQDGYLNTPTITDEIKAIRLTARRELHQSPFSSIDFGFNYTERNKDFVNDQYFLGVPGGASAVVPSAFLLAPTQLGYLGIPAVLSYDSIGLVNSGFYNLVRNPNADVLSGNWVVSEKVSIGYVKANIDHTFFGLPLTGNVGMQAVYTDQSSSGFSASGSGASTLSTPVTGGAEYLELLPSSNFILEAGDNLFIRFAVARTLARPRMDDMRASRNYSFDVSKNNAAARPDTNSPWGGGGGNPLLRPTVADVADISIEKYFANRKGYVSVAAFYKNLETYVYTKNQIFDFTGYPTGGVTPVINQGVVSAPANGEGGYVSGIEFALSVPFEMIHPMLEGFGAQISASQTSSEVKPDPASPPTTLPGLSETVANVTVYYERDGFQARISNRYRSDFLGEVAGFGNGRTLRSVAAESVVDAQIGYTFQSGPLENLGFQAQVNNLTDEPFKTFQNGDERQVIDFQRYGRTFLFGVSYKY